MTSEPAKLSNTRIMSIKKDSEYHLIAYSNDVENISGRPNAMILPIPGELSQQDFYDTTKYSSFMKEIEELYTVRDKGMDRFLGSSADDTLSFENFQLGMYNVFLSKSASLIGEAIKNLPDSERPYISKEMLDFFENHYSGWNLVVCCFSENKKIESQPIMFQYKPFNNDVLFFPAMDAHDGNPPKLDIEVEVDHFLITESDNYDEFEFETELIPDFLKNRNFYGSKQARYLINGDWYYYPQNHATNVGFERKTYPVIQKPVVHES